MVLIRGQNIDFMENCGKLSLNWFIIFFFQKDEVVCIGHHSRSC